MEIQPTEAQAAYDARWNRVMDCVRLRTPDRMPIGFQPTFWLAKYGNVTCKELMYNYEGTAAIAERALREFEPDVTSPMVLAVASGQVLEKADFKQLQWPGHGVGDNQPFQYIDREYMQADEFDEFLFDPTGFYLQKYLPRVAGCFEGVQDMPALPGLHYMRLMGALRLFNKPSIKNAFAKIFEAAEESERHAQHHLAFVAKMKAAGYPTSYLTSSVSPYDFIADYFRGATSMMKDLFRNKDKLMQLLDKASIFLSRMTIANAKASGNPYVFIPIHWAPDPFMSGKQFETFWWPPFRRMLINLIEADLIPMPMWESDCTKRLPIIGDIPAGTCVYWFERTDLVTAHEVLGDVVALRGNLSPSMMTTGTPEDVDAAVKHLANNVFHKGGKLILDCAFGVPDETSLANVQAMFHAARKYG